MATPTGRITLSDDKFIITTLAGERTEQAVASEAEFHALLRQHFGISVQTTPPQRQHDAS
jgi:arylamine N-acetyltransferase